MCTEDGEGLGTRLVNNSIFHLNLDSMTPSVILRAGCGQALCTMAVLTLGLMQARDHSTCTVKVYEHI